MTRMILSWVYVLAAPLAFCQNEGDELHHHNFAVGIGPAIPLGSATAYLSTSPFVRVAYGYRLNRLFQADFGFQMAFGAAHNQNSVKTDLGLVQGGDHEFLIPLGGRIYIPQPIKRIQVSAGGGAAYLHYSETVPSGGSYYTPSCYTCTTRGGWGGYGMANVSYFLDSNHNFRVGTMLQYIAGSTNGQAVANFPATKTTDHWLNLGFDFGLSF
jgi:hypothetical protein